MAITRAKVAIDGVDAELTDRRLRWEAEQAVRERREEINRAIEPAAFPTEPGWYWARFADGWEVVQVTARTQNGELLFEWIGGDDQELPVDDRSVETWGPRIPEPTEATYTILRGDLERAAAMGITITLPPGARLVVRD